MKKKIGKFIYRIGDLVKVICGDYKGKLGELILLNKGLSKATIKLKESDEILNNEKKIVINISNCMIIDQKNNTISRVGFKVENNKKVRYLKKTNQILNNLKN